MIYSNKILYEKSVTLNNPVPDIIETDNLHIKGPLHEHWSLGDFHKFQTDYCGEEMAKYNLYKKPETLAYTRNKMYKYMIKNWNNMEDMYYVLEEKETREEYEHDYIGVMGINFEWDKKYAELSIWLHKDVWGEEYFAEGAEAFFEVIFNHPVNYGIDLITLVPASQNNNSIKAIEKIMNTFNGQLDGIIRNYEFFDGIGVDNCHRFSIKYDEYINSN